MIKEVFTDNGEHSHWILIECESGKVLWNEDINKNKPVRVGDCIEIIPPHAKYKKPPINPFK